LLAGEGQTFDRGMMFRKDDRFTEEQTVLRTAERACIDPRSKQQRRQVDVERDDGICQTGAVDVKEQIVFARDHAQRAQFLDGIHGADFARLRNGDRTVLHVMHVAELAHVAFDVGRR
jgi:hypothetical protein